MEQVRKPIDSILCLPACLAYPVSASSRNIASRHPSSLMMTRRFHYFRLLSLHPLITMERMVLFSVVPTMLEPVSYVILHQDDSTHVDCAVSKNGRCQ